LDALFRRNVRRRPDAIALVDPPDRPAFTEGIARRLTYGEADRAVQTLALRLQALRLPAGAVVALQLPNTVESIIALLAVLRAGFVAAPVPLLWRTEAVRALGHVGARALIACPRLGRTDYNEIALNIAAETFSIRFVCGLGEHVPDGMVPLGDIFAVNSPTLAALAPSPHEFANATAVLTFEMGREGLAAIPHQQTELLVGGLAVVLEAAMQRNAVLIATVLVSSFSALATALVPWLLTGGTLVLHQPFEGTTLRAQLEEIRCDIAVLPGPLVVPLAEAGIIGRSEGPNIIGVWRSPEQQPGSDHWRGAASLIDVLAFGELGLVALRRGSDGEPAVMTAGPVTVPSGAASGTVVMTIGRTARGTLTLSGPMVPRTAAAQSLAGETAPDGSEHLADTGYPCRFDSTTRAVNLSGSPAGIVRIGGYRFAMAELQDLVGRLGPDGVLTALPDLLAGQKLAGADAAALQRALAALGVNPLVGAAFRDRRKGRAPAA